MLFFPWILILVLINLSKNTEHNFKGLEALICTSQEELGNEARFPNNYLAVQHM